HLDIWMDIAVVAVGREGRETFLGTAAPPLNAGREEQMHILITGAAGMIGRKLTGRLIRDGGLNGSAIDRMTLTDIMEPERPAGTPLTVATGATDLATAGTAARVIADRPDVIFHLAAIVSGEAEADFAKGYQVNFGGTRELLEA